MIRNPDPALPAGTLTRRTVLSLGAAAALTATRGPWTTEAEAATIPDAPPGLRFSELRFRSWDGTIVTEPLLSCRPTSTDGVVAAVNWAHRNNHRVRPHGYRHNWSPLAVTHGTKSSESLLMLDMRALTNVSMIDRGVARAQTGATMESLLTVLDRAGRGLLHVPAPGEITIGGALAIGGHGTAVPTGRKTPRGGTHGCFSNTIRALTVITWDPRAAAYRPERIERSDPRCASFLVNLGRALVTEVEVQSAPRMTWRCQSRIDIDIDELFAPPERATRRSMSALLDEAGRVGVIWPVFTRTPWLQVWTDEPTKPIWSRRVSRPYNFPQASQLPAPVADLISRTVSGQYWLAPALGSATLTATAAVLTATATWDIWGAAKNFQHFVTVETLRVRAGAHAVVCARRNVQRVLHDFTRFYNERLGQHRARGSYPVNIGCEIRVTGIDRPGDVGIPGAEAPRLSAARPVPGRPELDTTVWLDVLTLPGTPGLNGFFAELEGWFREFPASIGVVRPEWAKLWGVSSAGPWTDFRIAHRDQAALRAAAADFDAADPHGLFRSPLVDRLV